MMKIEIASDVMCPWCAIGYKNLENALTQLGSEVEADISFQAFELNPNMPEEGQNIREHIMEKYGATADQSQENQKRITEMGQVSGFEFNFHSDGIMINTFDCHRLLAWSKQFGKQVELKMALFKAHFTDGRYLNKKTDLLDVVTSVGLDTKAAETVLDSNAFSEDVRNEESKLQQMGIHSVPTFIINDQYSISGGQPAETFVQALRQIQSQSSQTE